MMPIVFSTSEATPEAHTRIGACRVCGSADLRLFLSFGQMPLANAFLRSPDEFATEARYPLDVFFCAGCSLVQLVDVIHPELLFRDYIYVTGTSDTMARHNVEYARTVAELLKLISADLVVEVASNDGSLLGQFQALGVRTLGVEPATNIAEIARARGIETLNRFFNAAVAREVRPAYGPAKAVIGNNVLAHVNETRDFLSGCRALLAEDGLVIIEVPYLQELLDRLEYDTIYHEHLCYFSVTTLARLCDAVGLSLVRLDHVPVHGGSLRMYAGLPEHYGPHAAEVLALIEEERRLGLHDFGRYRTFADEVERSRAALRDLLESLKRQGRNIAGYGAPAKGNTLLNYCQIDTRLLSFTVDKNPLKVGLYTPGMHIPVLPVDSLLERQPDDVLILAWNYAAEVMRQQAGYRERGGRFIVPIPQPRVIGD
jgi:hypothetical protein